MRAIFIVQVDQATNVLDVLKKLVDSWAAQLQAFNQDDSLGEVDYNGQKADAAGTAFSLFGEMKDVSV